MVCTWSAFLKYALVENKCFTKFDCFFYIYYVTKHSITEVCDFKHAV